MTATGDEKYRIWDTYWRDNRIYSAGPDADADVAAALERKWIDAAAALPDGARVLDLACGNGFVALTVARAAKNAGKAITLDGIDAADIDPRRYLTSDADLLGAIAFRGRTRMEQLPFEAGSFDAVFSNFGIEFGDLAKSTAEVGRVLKPGGITTMLAMASRTPLVEQLDRKARQSRHILTKTKIFDVAIAVAQAISVYESTGEGREPRQYLQRFSAEVQSVMAKVSDADAGSAIAVTATLQTILTERKNVDIASQVDAISTLKSRLTEHAARSEAIVRSALGEASLTGLGRRLNEAGVRDVDTGPLAVGAQGTVAWQISAKKG